LPRIKASRSLAVFYNQTARLPSARDPIVFPCVQP
jgi:hypothetical protein